MGLPKKAHPLIPSGPRVVCTGIAKLLDLPTDGRRDASGSIAPRRSEEYCFGTSPALAAVMQCKSDVQCPHRVPPCRATHDPECKDKDCVKANATVIKNLCHSLQRSQNNISGYFGGYISKSQPIRVYDLKRAIATLPFLKKKLLEPKAKPSHHPISPHISRI